MIKPIQLSSFSRVSERKISKTNRASIASKSLSKQDSFGAGKNPAVNLRVELLEAQYELFDLNRRYILLKTQLDKTFGDDWVFCYDDLNNEQSEMYINCMDTQAEISKCVERIKFLTQKLKSNTN